MQAGPFCSRGPKGENTNTGLMLMKALVLTTILAVLCGCNSAHNAFIVTNTTSASLQSPTRYPSHAREVFVTEEGLGPQARYELLEQIEVGKAWYGSSKDVLESMADRARQIGADAVVEVKTWHQPSGWSWAAPHGSGEAVRFADSLTNNVSGLRGKWL